MLQRMHAQNIVSSSKHDPRGEWTTTVGDVVIDGKAMVFTKLYIVGPHSVLFATALEPAKGDESTKRRFFASIARRPARPDSETRTRPVSSLQGPVIGREQPVRSGWYRVAVLQELES